MRGSRPGSSQGLSCSAVEVLGFEVEGLGFEVLGLGFEGLGIRVQDFELTVK